MLSDSAEYLLHHMPQWTYTGELNIRKSLDNIFQSICVLNFELFAILPANKIMSLELVSKLNNRRIYFDKVFYTKLNFSFFNNTQN